MISKLCLLEVVHYVERLELLLLVADPGAEQQHSGDVLNPEDFILDDNMDRNGEAEDIGFDTADVDDDNDEFVEWNEGDGNFWLFVVA